MKTKYIFWDKLNFAKNNTQPYNTSDRWTVVGGGVVTLAEGLNENCPISERSRDCPISERLRDFPFSDCLWDFFLRDDEEDDDEEGLESDDIKSSWDRFVNYQFVIKSYKICQYLNIRESFHKILSLDSRHAKSQWRGKVSIPPFHISKIIARRARTTETARLL